jgi:hypothetical protein
MEKSKSTYKLPEGWIWTTIGEIGIVQSGGTPSTRNKEFWGDEIAWLKEMDVQQLFYQTMFYLKVVQEKQSVKNFWKKQICIQF